MDQAEDTIRVNELTVRYGNVEALDSVSFDLGPGITGLLGPNGAGKSTLLRVLATAQEFGHGTVTEFGLDLGDRRHRRETRRRLGYLPQTPGLYPSLTVRSFVNHFALLKEIRDRSARSTEVLRVLTEVGLQDRASTKVRKLSGGMRQRLALACSILGDPRLLILDEPTVGLDPEQRARFREMVAHLGAARTVVLSTHQTDDIAAVCQRVLVLRNGTIRFDDTSQALRGRARGRTWIADQHVPDAIASWATGDGRFRNVGSPDVGSTLIEPTIDDGYLVVSADADGRLSTS